MAGRAVLDARRRALARPATPPSATDALHLLSFTLAGESYSVEARYVYAVVRLAEVAALPGAQPPVCGVTGWRGELLTVLDLRPVLGLSAAALNDLGQVIVLGAERPAFGLLVDAAQELITVPAAAVREAAEGVAADRSFLMGITGDALVVLDAAALLHLHG